MLRDVILSRFGVCMYLFVLSLTHSELFFELESCDENKDTAEFHYLFSFCKSLGVPLNICFSLKMLTNSEGT